MSSVSLASYPNIGQVVEWISPFVASDVETFLVLSLETKTTERGGDYLMMDLLQSTGELIFYSIRRCEWPYCWHVL